MSLADGYPHLVVKNIPVSTATTDAATVVVPFGGRGYVVRAVTFYNAQGGSAATAQLGVFNQAAGGGTALVALATLGALTGASTAANATLATPVFQNANSLFIRVGTTSAPAGTTVDCIIEYAALV
jgi:hypothetical protein